MQSPSERHLRIIVLNLPNPLQFEQFGRLTLELQGKKRTIQGISSSEGLVFEVAILVEDGRARGEWVHQNSDKRPFIYLTWYDEARRIVRRIKLYWEQFKSIEGEVRLWGVDAKGLPACSTAKLG